MRIYPRSSVPLAESGGREMSTIGVFAGRGDVLVAMALAFVLGAWLGWRLRGFLHWVKTKHID